MQSSGFPRAGCLSYHSTAWRFWWLGWEAGWSWWTDGEEERKQRPRRWKTGDAKPAWAARLGGVLKHRDAVTSPPVIWLLVFVFFLCIFWQIDSRNHGFCVFYYFFSTAGQWYMSAEQDIPTAGATGHMPWWPASILSPSAFLQMALKAGWLHFFPEETKTHRDPPLEIYAFPKDFIRICNGGDEDHF